MSIWQMLAILLLSLSGDLQPNTEVLLGVPGTPRISLDVQNDGWIDLSVKADTTPPANTAKFKVENDTFIFAEGTGEALASAAASRDARGNTRISITDALAAASSDSGGTIKLKEYGPRLISLTMKEGKIGTAAEITVTRRDGNIVIGTPDAVMVQMPVTINQPDEKKKR